MRRLNGGELVIEALKNHGARQVFSIAGGQMGTLYHAIGRDSEVDLYTPRNETVAPIMAAGYVVSSGRPAVSMTTVGAGVVYEVAGLLKAWLDYIPVISVAPQVQSYKMKPHQENLQACSQDELFSPLTKWNAIVYNWDRLPRMIDRAFREALNPAPGPVHLDIPVDLLFKRKILADKTLKKLLPAPGKTRFVGTMPGDPAQIKTAAGILSAAKRPIVMVGQGLGRPGRCPDIGKALEMLGAPTLASRLSPSVLKSKTGVGFAELFLSDAQGREILARADCMVVAGLDRYIRPCIFAAAGQIPVVQIEQCPDAFLADRTVFAPVHADPDLALAEIASICGGPAFDGWREDVSGVAASIAGNEKGLPADLTAAVKRMAEEAGEHDIIVADGEFSVPAVMRNMRGPVCANIHCMDDGEVKGAGLPFALGAAVANPASRVALVCDWSALIHHVREIQPAMAAGAKLAMIVQASREEGRASDPAEILAGLGCEVRKTGDGMSDLFDKFDSLSGPAAMMV